MAIFNSYVKLPEGTCWPALCESTNQWKKDIYVPAFDSSLHHDHCLNLCISCAQDTTSPESPTTSIRSPKNDGNIWKLRSSAGLMIPKCERWHLRCPKKTYHYTRSKATISIRYIRHSPWSSPTRNCEMILAALLVKPMRPWAAASGEFVMQKNLGPKQLC